MAKTFNDLPASIQGAYFGGGGSRPGGRHVLVLRPALE